MCFVFITFTSQDTVDNAVKTMTPVQVLPVSSNSMDQDEETVVTGQNNGLKSVNASSHSISLSPVSGDVSDPETEMEEDHESTPYNKSKEGSTLNDADNESKAPCSVSFAIR